jgi:hypothetical protein
MRYPTPTDKDTRMNQQQAQQVMGRGDIEVLKYRVGVGPCAVYVEYLTDGRLHPVWHISVPGDVRVSRTLMLVDKTFDEVLRIADGFQRLWEDVVTKHGEYTAADDFLVQYIQKLDARGES